MDIIYIIYKTMVFGLLVHRETFFVTNGSHEYGHTFVSAILPAHQNAHDRRKGPVFFACFAA